MMHNLRQQACEALSTESQVLMSAGGPADIQTEMLRCEAVGLSLYVLVPRASDLLFNLENTTSVLATSDTWHARGTARVLPPGELYPDQLAIARTPAVAWCEVVEFCPTRLQMRSLDGANQGETIDIG